MLDGVMRKVIDPPLNALGSAMAAIGITANAVTLVGLVLGLAAATYIAIGWFLTGLAFIAASRIADGLDGAVARATTKTDFGGFLDISADFLFYGAVPLGFVIADPANNAIAGAFLITSFYFNGATFLGYAILAEKQKLTTEARGVKSLYFTGGLLEGTETIAFFIALCIWPNLFPVLSAIFGILVFITAGSRVLLAWKLFGAPTKPTPPPSASS